jgi:hypothetical protein
MNRSIDVQLQMIRIAAMTPMLLVMFAGLILAIRKLPQQSRSCWALIVATVLAAFHLLGLPVLMNAVLFYAGVNFANTRELWLRTVLFTLPQALVGALYWGLILFAIFDRPAPPKFLEEHVAAPERGA